MDVLYNTPKLTYKRLKNIGFCLGAHNNPPPPAQFSVYQTILFLLLTIFWQVLRDFGGVDVLLLTQACSVDHPGPGFSAQFPTPQGFVALCLGTGK